MEKQYTPEQLRYFEAVCFLKGLKVGDPITHRVLESLEITLGKQFKALGEPKLLATFDVNWPADNEA